MTRIRPLAFAAVGVLLLTGCQRSAEALRNAVDDKSGVISVEVYDNGGEADIPFSKLPWIVNVEMEPDSTTAQIKDVAGAYEEDMKDAEVESLTIKIADRGDLEMGETTGETEPWATVFGEGLQDPRVARIYVSAWTPGPSIDVYLRSGGFATLKSFVERYRADFDPADLSVDIDGFSFRALESQHSGSEARSAARLRTTTSVDQKFHLKGARIWGSGALRLVVGPGPALATVRAFANKHAAPGTGRIAVIRVVR